MNRVVEKDSDQANVVRSRGARRILRSGMKVDSVTTKQRAKAVWNCGVVS